MTSPMQPSNPTANDQRPTDKKPADKKKTGAKKSSDQKTGEKRDKGGLISRVKSVLTRSDSAGRKSASKLAAHPAVSVSVSVSGSGSGSQTSQVPNPNLNPNPNPNPNPAAGSYVAVTIQLSPPKSAHQRAAEARARYEAMHGVTTLTRSELFQERAKTLSQRFGLDLPSSQWQTPASKTDDTVRRIDKPIRLRIRRTCHRCNATFPCSTKECPGCDHVRCTNCSRYPPSRTEAELAASRQKRAAIIKAHKEIAPIVIDWSWTGAGAQPPQLPRPSKTGGQDLVHKKLRQRVRRTCHACGKLFRHGSKTCEGCQHVRCTDCPRDPPKKNNYPLGYPGDVFGEKSIPRYECEQCHTLYPAAAEDGAPCAKCKKPKSERSPRALPRKIDPSLDEDAVAQIQAKLSQLAVA